MYFLSPVSCACPSAFVSSVASLSRVKFCFSKVHGLCLSVAHQALASSLHHMHTNGCIYLQTHAYTCTQACTMHNTCTHTERQSDRHTQRGYCNLACFYNIIYLVEFDRRNCRGKINKSLNTCFLL